MNTPKTLGFRMPAEWAPHERCWMMWPCRRVVWPDIEATRREFAKVAQAIRRFEPVTMVCRPEDEKQARAALGTDIDLLPAPIDDSWARDSGPCFLVDERGRLAGVDFRFNAWGGKYAPFDADDAVSRRILAQAGARRFESPLIAEGGGVSVDGEGTILTTETCFPNRNRNPDWSRARIERELMEMLGGDKVIWLPGDPLDIETDGHVDGIAVFAGTGKVLIEDTADPTDPWRKIRQANIDALRGQTDAKGRTIELVMIPDAFDAPSTNPIFCRSYVNAYFANDGVVMPAYRVATDARAREIFEEMFPEREVVGVGIDNIAVGGGGIHCITQQQPLVRGIET